jgi:hypothetical protein
MVFAAGLAAAVAVLPVPRLTARLPVRVPDRLLADEDGARPDRERLVVPVPARPEARLAGGGRMTSVAETAGSERSATRKPFVHEMFRVKTFSVTRSAAR